jgi:NAD-dependent deacetylase
VSRRRRLAIDAQFSTARPGRRHEALASLHRAGKVAAAIAQTIDTLRQAAGIPGRRSGSRCTATRPCATWLEFGRRDERGWVRERFAAGSRSPDREECGATSRRRRFPSARPDSDHV